MKVVILAAAIGTTSGGAGQYERQVLPHLLPILKAAGCQVTVLLCRDANLQLPSNLATVIHSPKAVKQKNIEGICWRSCGPLSSLGEQISSSRWTRGSR